MTLLKKWKMSQESVFKKFFKKFLKNFKILKNDFKKYCDGQIPLF
jgi:hypothetical protein